MLAADPVTIVVGMGAARSIQFTDPNGTPATIFVAGPGSANVTFNGTGITQSATATGVTVNGTGVTLSTVQASGTSAASVLHIDVKGRGTIGSGSISTDGVLGSLHAPNVLVSGNITAGGWVHFIQVAGVQGGAVTIGAARNSSASLIANLGSVDSESLTSAIPIQSLNASQWTNTSSAPIGIQSPQIQSLNVKGSFTAGLTLTASGKAPELGTFRTGDITGGTWNLAGNVGTISTGTISGLTASIGGTIGAMNVSHDASMNLTAGAINSINIRGTLSGSRLALINPLTRTPDLGSLTVGGNILTTNIRSIGSIGSVSATLMHDSQVYAGLVNLPDGQTLPQLPSDFSNTAQIGSISLRRSASASFANGDIAAYLIGNASLGSVAMANGGVSFGLAAHQIKALTLTDQATGKTVHSGNVVSTASFNAFLAAKGITQQDFVVRII